MKRTITPAKHIENIKGQINGRVWPEIHNNNSPTKRALRRVRWLVTNERSHSVIPNWTGQKEKEKFSSRTALELCVITITHGLNMYKAPRTASTGKTCMW